MLKLLLLVSLGAFASVAIDEDEDGYGADPPGLSDCDDNDASVYPGAPELCDRLANDCLRSDWPSLPPDEVDVDLDGFAECDGDCNDQSAMASPNGVEVCDGLDNNCDGMIDADFDGALGSKGDLFVAKESRTVGPEGRRPDAGRQSVLSVVRQPDRLVFVLEPQDAQDRPEQLFLHHLHIVRRI